VSDLWKRRLMSLYEYKESQQIAAQDFGFYALIMAAARKADTGNFAALEYAFPSTIAELKLRYNAPDGRIGTEMETNP